MVIVYTLIRFSLECFKTLCNYYSILMMNIRNVNRDHRNFCLYVPLTILPGLNADQQPSRSVHGGNIVESFL